MRRVVLRITGLAWVGALAMLAGTQSLAAEVTAQLDRRELVEGETVTLVLQTSDSQQSLEADLSVLDRDFEVIDQRSETHMSIIDGRQSAVVRRMITLEPKRAGTLRIPGLVLPGGAGTPPLEVKVAPAPALAPGELPPVFIEVELEPREGPYYVHAQLSMKVRIFYQQNLTEAAINPPSPPQASVRLLDEVPYQADRDGQRYRVLERRYAIFPERSGELTIPPMQLTGRLIERASERLWQPSVRGRRIRIESEPLMLTISPRPPEYGGDHWLPARRVDLSQQITDADSLRVGEPVTRTVILDAVGLEEHMLEEPAWPVLEDARIYPDRPQGISRDDGEWVLGHREFRYAVVPERAGELMLPELRLHWWDTVANRERVAVLPGHRLEVLPSQLAAVTPVQGMPGGAEPGSGTARAAGGRELLLWRALAAAFAVLWLATLWWTRRQRLEGTGTPARSTEDTERESALIREIRRTCRQGDARAARESMRRWVRACGPPAAGGSLMGLSATCGSPELAAAIRELDASRFGGPGRPGWSGDALWRAFEAWRTEKYPRSAPEQDAVFDLYSAVR